MGEREINACLRTHCQGDIGAYSLREWLLLLPWEGMEDIWNLEGWAKVLLTHRRGEIKNKDFCTLCQTLLSQIADVGFHTANISTMDLCCLLWYGKTNDFRGNNILY